MTPHVPRIETLLMFYFVLNSKLYVIYDLRPNHFSYEVLNGSETYDRLLLLLLLSLLLLLLLQLMLQSLCLTVVLTI